MTSDVCAVIAKRLRTQADAAQMYAALVLAKRYFGAEMDWLSINESITQRWSRAGLIRVKRMAWKKVEEIEKQALKARGVTT